MHPSLHSSWCVLAAGFTHCVRVLVLLLPPCSNRFCAAHTAESRKIPPPHRGLVLMCTRC